MAGVGANVLRGPANVDTVTFASVVVIRGGSVVNRTAIRDGEPPDPVDIRLLGPVGVWRGERRIALAPQESGKVRCLLAALVRVPGAPVATEVLVQRVWGDRLVGPAVRYKYVGWLRAALASHGIGLAQSAQGYRLEIDPNLVDLHRFQVGTDRAGAATRGGRWAEAAAILRAAIDEWHGQALLGVPGEWAELFRNELASQRRAAMVLRFQLALTLGAAAEHVPALAGWEAENPTDETVVGLHMLALHRAGQRAAAVECFQRARRRIREGLDAEPAGELEALYRRIQANDADLMTMPIVAGEPSTIAIAGGARPNNASPAGERGSRDAAGVPRQLPPAVRHLAGRACELGQLDVHLDDRPTGGSVTTAIAGTAGVGKTTLAVHWAHQVGRPVPGRPAVRRTCAGSTRAAPR